jgi:hypothetical protein
MAKAHDDDNYIKITWRGGVRFTGVRPLVGGTSPRGLESDRATFVLQRCHRASCRPPVSSCASSPAPIAFLGLPVPRRFGAKGPFHHILPPPVAIDSHTRRADV